MKNIYLNDRAELLWIIEKLLASACNFKVTATEAGIFTLRVREEDEHRVRVALTLYGTPNQPLADRLVIR